MGWNLPEQLGGAAVETDAIGEHQLKWTQSGSSSRSGRNRGVAIEADAIREPQLKWTHRRAAESRAAAEADANREQQLKRIDAITRRAAH